VKTQAERTPPFRTGSNNTHSHTVRALVWCKAEPSFLLLLHKPKWVDTVEGEWSRQERTSLSGDASTTLTWACKTRPF